MENAESERIEITDLPDGMKIIIRAGRAWQDIAMLAIPFILIGVFVLLFASNRHFAVAICCCLPALITVVSGARWFMSGREEITIADGVFTIKTIGGRAYKPGDAFTLAAMHNFIAKKTNSYYFSRYPGGMRDRGTVRFEYDDNSFSFGDMLSEEEGNYIIERLREKGLIG